MIIPPPFFRKLPRWAGGIRFCMHAETNWLKKRKIDPDNLILDVTTIYEQKYRFDVRSGDILSSSRIPNWVFVWVKVGLLFVSGIGGFLFIIYRRWLHPRKSRNEKYD